MSDKNQNVKEIIVYRVKTNEVDDFTKNGLDQLRSFAQGQPGMKKHTTFRSVKNQDVFVDFVSWDSLEQAEAAVAKMDELSKSEEVQRMMQSFEKVEFFDHFKLVP